MHLKLPYTRSFEPSNYFVANSNLLETFYIIMQVLSLCSSTWSERDAMISSHLKHINMSKYLYIHGFPLSLGLGKMCALPHFTNTCILKEDWVNEFEAFITATEYQQTTQN